jgi:hypothetical protein
MMAHYLHQKTMRADANDPVNDPDIFIYLGKLLINTKQSYLQELVVCPAKADRILFRWISDYLDGNGKSTFRSQTEIVYKTYISL